MNRERTTRTTVLCVDDEPNVLEGLALHLRRRYDVTTATSADTAIDWLEEGPSVAVIISDMRMPGTDGAAFLARARQLAPDAVRILLTGHADLEAAARSVNEGQVFRFLTKPCPPPQLMSAVAAAEAQHKLITAERVLLEQTLTGAIKALTDVLALANPACFGRATRIKALVAELCDHLDLELRWQLDVAAMLSQLGFVALPHEVVEKVYFGVTLTDAEAKMVGRVPAINEQLLGNIPRLEVVRGILAGYTKPFRRTFSETPFPNDPLHEVVEKGAQVLKVAIDFDALIGGGDDVGRAIDTLRGRLDRYDPKVVGALGELKGRTRPVDEIKDLPIAALRAGMILADDVKATSGTLLLARGYEVTAGFLERARNFRPGSVKEPVRVIVRRSHKDPVV